MNRRHSQSSNATPVKSLTMSDGANAAVGLLVEFSDSPSR